MRLGVKVFHALLHAQVAAHAQMDEQPVSLQADDDELTPPCHFLHPLPGQALQEFRFAGLRPACAPRRAARKRSPCQGWASDPAHPAAGCVQWSQLQEVLAWL